MNLEAALSLSMVAWVASLAETSTRRGGVAIATHSASVCLDSSESTCSIALSFCG